jgi:Rhodanese-related sulfurtransferase
MALHTVVLFPKRPSPEDTLNCSYIGVLGVLPGIVGSIQANEVLKIILEFKEVLSGKLYCYNAKTNASQTISVAKNVQLFSQIKGMPLKEIQTQICTNKNNEISIEEAIQKENSLFLDVRELNEKPNLPIHNYQRIPLKNIAENLDKINPKKEIIVFCQSGMRSKHAVQILRENNFDKTYSLSDGATALLMQLKK